MGEFADLALNGKAGNASSTVPRVELVCAVVVAYHAEEEVLARIAALLGQVTMVIVVDNTPGEGALKGLKDLDSSVCLVENKANLGIASALNIALAMAQKKGFHWMLTLDQDTRCESDMVSVLLKISASCGEGYAVIGSNYFDPRSNRTKVTELNCKEWKEQKTVITSGSLVDVTKAHSVGGFRDDFFIDQVDHEFCLRLRAHGYKVAITCKPLMTHSVGNAGGVRIPFLGVLPNHSPSRKYYIARNTVVTVANYWRREPEWCLRRLVRLLLGLGGMALLEERRISKVRAFMYGILDGFQGRMGPCQRELIP
jgi:rhamnosyltransferase